MPESYTPSPIVQFAPGYTGPYVEVPSSAWVDVSVYASFTRPTRGRSSEIDQFGASTCTIRLEADDRRFDPLNTAGPYYGQLKPNTPFRILGRMPGPTDYPIWYGYADAWRHQPTTFTSSVEVPCTDLFKFLNGRRLPTSVYELAVRADSPRAYWHLGEADGDAFIDLSGNGYDGSWSKGDKIAERGTDPIVPYSSARSLRFPTNVIGRGVRMPDDAEVTGSAFTVECWIRVDDPFLVESQVTILNTASKIIACQGDPTGLRYWQLDISWDSATSTIIDRFVLRALTPNGTNWDISKYLLKIDDGLPHHVVLSVASNTSRTLYFDGQPAAVFQLLTSQSIIPVAGFPGLWVGPQDQASGRIGLPGRVAELALYDTALTADQVAAHYQAAAYPWVGDTTGQRIARVCDAINLPAGLRALDDGEVLVGPADLAATPVLEYLQLLTSSEQGRLFVSSDGKLTFHGNYRTVTGTPVYTFDEGDGMLLEEGLALSVDDTFLYDEAIVQRKYGEPQRALADGVTDPVRTFTADGLLSIDDRMTRNQAQRVVWRYGEAKTRLEGWTIQPEQVPADWPTIFDLEIGDVVTVEITPASTGAPIELDLFVESIEHDISTDDWTVALTGSPVDDSPYFTIGGDGATLGIGTGLIR